MVTLLCKMGTLVDGKARNPMRQWAPKQKLAWLRAFLCLALSLFHGGKTLAAAALGAPALSGTLDAQFAFADFDGDQKPDLAVLHVERFNSLKTRYSLIFALSAGNRQTMEIVGPSGGLQIFSRDVNGDNTPDLIVEAVRRNQPVAVFLNDGFGNFTLADPARYPMDLQQSDSGLRPTAVPGEHGAALLGSKTIPGESSESSALHPLRRTSGNAFFRNFRADNRTHFSSFSGRAPPALRNIC
jgi:hypothetical protein